MAVGADFHCFKNEIESKWEYPVCANRGKWTACFSKGKSDPFLALHAVNVRTKQEKIALSTKNAANEAAQPLTISNDCIFKPWFMDQYAFNLFKFSWQLVQFVTFFMSLLSFVMIFLVWASLDLPYSLSGIGFIFHEEAKRIDRGASQ